MALVNDVMPGCSKLLCSDEFTGTSAENFSVDFFDFGSVANWVNDWIQLLTVFAFLSRLKPELLVKSES